MKQAKTLLAQNWLGNLDCRDPVILLGDFNARRRSIVYRMFTARLRDAQLVLHTRARRTFPARMPTLCMTIFSAAERSTCSASRCREASSSARRRITCR